MYEAKHKLFESYPLLQTLENDKKKCNEMKIVTNIVSQLYIKNLCRETFFTELQAS